MATCFSCDSVDVDVSSENDTGITSQGSRGTFHRLLVALWSLAASLHYRNKLYPAASHLMPLISDIPGFVPYHLMQQCSELSEPSCLE